MLHHVPVEQPDGAWHKWVLRMYQCEFLYLPGKQREYIFTMPNLGSDLLLKWQVQIIFQVTQLQTVKQFVQYPSEMLCRRIIICVKNAKIMFDKW